AVRVVQPLTSEKSRALAGVGSIVAGGDTAIYDAAESAADLLEAADPKARRAIVLLTDGLDTASHGSRQSAVKRLQSSGFPLYAIGLGNGIDRGTLDALSGAVRGGATYLAPSSSDLAAIYGRLSEQLLTEYSVAFPQTAARPYQRERSGGGGSRGTTAHRPSRGAAPLDRPRGRSSAWHEVRGTDPRSARACGRSDRRDRIPRPSVLTDDPFQRGDHHDRRSAEPRSRIHRRRADHRWGGGIRHAGHRDHDDHSGSEEGDAARAYPVARHARAIGRGRARLRRCDRSGRAALEEPVVRRATPSPARVSDGPRAEAGAPW